MTVELLGVFFGGFLLFVCLFWLWFPPPQALESNKLKWSVK